MSKFSFKDIFDYFSRKNNRRRKKAQQHTLSKGEKPKCKTCESFIGCPNNPFHKTMKPACECYNRKKK